MQKILILGATSTIAAQVARIHAARGDRLFLVGRSGHKLQALADELGEAVAGTATTDFNDTSAHDHCLESAVKALGCIDRAVIAHGDLGDQDRSQVDPGHAMEVIHTNFLSAVALIVALSPIFERQGTGALGVLSSVAGERGRPKNYTYGAAKSGLTTYLEGLRSRWWQRHAVTCIRLGPVSTPMTEGHQKNFLFATPERAARDIVRALDREAADVYVPWYWGPIMSLVRRVPQSLFQRVSFLSGKE